MRTRKWQIYAFHLLVQVDKLDILPGFPNKQALEDFAEFRQIMVVVVVVVIAVVVNV